MSRPVLLDLYCGAGGAAMGYSRAGFDVIGVDINPQPRYPFEFMQRDALAVLIKMRPDGPIAAVHASPPCQAHSALRTVAPGHTSGWMLPAVRHYLNELGLPYVIENVMGADMPGSIVLCGKHFGLSAVRPDRGLMHLRRHRQFESNIKLAPPGKCSHPRSEKTIGVYGNGDGGGRGFKGSFAVRKAAMGIDWMNRNELAQAIPPAYTEYIGAQLMAAVMKGRNSEAA